MTAAQDALTAATRQIGKPYLWGAEGPNRFDCSGLMQYAYELAGLSLPRTADQQMRATTPVEQPQPGDLVFYTRGGRAYHVGMYAGNGRMIDAPGRGRRVQLRGVWGTPARYGRVQGSGAGLASTVQDALTWPLRTADEAADTILGAARDTATRGTVLAGAAVLVVLGAWVSTGRLRRGRAA